MGRSKETFGKKEVRNKKAKKRKDKERRRMEKKEEGKQNFDDMIAYVDENGRLSSTPPDLTNKEEVDVSTIEIGVPKKELRDDFQTRFGKISRFDEMRNYGFIADSKSNESVFLHANDCIDEVRDGDKVEFETERTPKGLKAINVKLKK